MIFRDQGLVFVHIPRTAGTSIEWMLEGVKRDPSDPPDYETGWGWDPEHRVWMQHLTLTEMLEVGLLSPDELTTFTKVAVVRNPYDRAVSDYQHLRRRAGPVGSFRNMIEGTGPWKRTLNDRTGPHYRGDHLRPQVEYISLDDTIAVDFMGRFEQLDDMVEFLRVRLSRPELELPNHNASMRKTTHYSHFYRDFERDLVRRSYTDDLQVLGYDFDDRRSEVHAGLRALRRTHQSARSRWVAVRRVIGDIVKRRG